MLCCFHPRGGESAAPQEAAVAAPKAAPTVRQAAASTAATGAAVQNDADSGRLVSPAKGHLDPDGLLVLVMEAHPEPCSVYMLTSGALLLQNRAASDLGLAGSLQALFAFDQGSLHDALSKIHTSIPWRGERCRHGSMAQAPMRVPRGPEDVARTRHLTKPRPRSQASSRWNAQRSCVATQLRRSRSVRRSGWPWRGPPQASLPMAPRHRCPPSSEPRTAPPALHEAPTAPQRKARRPRWAKTPPPTCGRRSKWWHCRTRDSTTGRRLCLCGRTERPLRL
jgi:hypothetical protein